MKKSFKLAYSGIMVAISLVSMFMAGIFPFAEYTFPAISGAILIVLVIHFGYKQSLIAYISVAILSLILTPNKESALLFCCFFGYYPIVKGLYERIKSLILSWLLKLATFNVAVVLAYSIIIYVFNVTEFLQDFDFAKYGVFLFLIIGNVVFVIYDLALSRVISMYVHRIAPKYFNKYMK